MLRYDRDDDPTCFLPEHLQDGVQRYIEQGIYPGDFLTSVITNNLKEAVGHADHVSAAALGPIVRWFFNEAPGACWGGKATAKAWADASQDDRDAVLSRRPLEAGGRS